MDLCADIIFLIREINLFCSFNYFNRLTVSCRAPQIITNYSKTLVYFQFSAHHASSQVILKNLNSSLWKIWENNKNCFSWLITVFLCLISFNECKCKQLPRPFKLKKKTKKTFQELLYNFKFNVEYRTGTKIYIFFFYCTDYKKWYKCVKLTLLNNIEVYSTVTPQSQGMQVLIFYS